MNEIGIHELTVMAKKYGFKNILDFSVWVEDNNLADVLGIKGEEEDEEEINAQKEDKNSRGYKAKVLALEIMSLPEVQEKLKGNHKISIDQWEKWAQKVVDNKKKININ